ncbi:hypothetical protein NDI76_05740 [Halogeometricum sp. S1BR25-6]|uniref:Uncharacterized protein n=1 Tax=Halogeometricum salsisoli TaxID=2950536 RepID=A0ABU2GBS0_9EURY|nr:hypothetical protein [Halogeometricum sp. S1BR25-6]MDS0298237.1 hypothetical protein [Halogeometricum sp. S1BR25-6]
MEVGTDVQEETKGTDPDMVIAIGITFSIVGIGGAAMGGFSAVAILFGLLSLGIGSYTCHYGKSNYKELKDSYEVTEHLVYHILMRTTATSPFSMPIYIETKENIGPDLSRLVQETN